jgi:hypothetical protein
MSPAKRLGLLQTGDLIIVPEGSVPPRALPRPFLHGRKLTSDDSELNSRKLLRNLIAGRKAGKKD